MEELCYEELCYEEKKQKIIDNQKEYAMYLRKSRKDIEAEIKGESETLARHEKILTELAKKLGIHIGKIYKEIVSRRNY